MGIINWLCCPLKFSSFLSCFAKCIMYSYHRFQFALLSLLSLAHAAAKTHIYIDQLSAIVRAQFSSCGDDVQLTPSHAFALIRAPTSQASSRPLSRTDAQPVPLHLHPRWKWHHCLPERKKDKFRRRHRRRSPRSCSARWRLGTATVPRARNRRDVCSMCRSPAVSALTRTRIVGSTTPLTVTVTPPQTVTVAPSSNPQSSCHHCSGSCNYWYFGIPVYAETLETRRSRNHHCGPRTFRWPSSRACSWQKFEARDARSRKNAYEMDQSVRAGLDGDVVLSAKRDLHIST
ncbi:hypothetical protein BS50DRAFT_55893 [Corynespora cassiicola Philippines]|uniref:Uncharacterized protein n=1 Tax=Corynespora cassiicola Philippines TaxID=1448308 RepID=A0A2T2NIS4_CORCC|nr:hypothetical protein BS50DRAFT_55893 [Corynespora cassiicola Philippines]